MKFNISDSVMTSALPLQSMKEVSKGILGVGEAQADIQDVVMCWPWVVEREGQAHFLNCTEPSLCMLIIILKQ